MFRSLYQCLGFGLGLFLFVVYLSICFLSWEESTNLDGMAAISQKIFFKCLKYWRQKGLFASYNLLIFMDKRVNHAKPVITANIWSPTICTPHF